MRKCTCPNCNANLQFGEDREFGFCEFCGTKILLDDYRSTHRFVDEAKVHEVDAMAMLRLKELELEKQKQKKSTVLFSILAIVMLFTALYTFISKDGFGGTLLMLELMTFIFLVRDSFGNNKKDEKS